MPSPAEALAEVHLAVVLLQSIALSLQRLTQCPCLLKICVQLHDLLQQSVVARARSSVRPARLHELDLHLFAKSLRDFTVVYALKYEYACIFTKPGK